MPPPASQTRVRPRNVACHGRGASRCGPCMLPAICAGPWWLTKIFPPSADSAAATTYSCSAVRSAVGACVAASWPSCASQQGTWGSSCAVGAATGPNVTAATADASAVRSAGLYCLSPVVSRAMCLQAAVQATAPQFVQSGSASSAPLLPLLLYPGGCVERGALLQRLRALPQRCAPRHSGCVWYGFCRRCSGAARGRKRSWCRYQWPCAADGLQSVSHCSTTPPGCAASTRRGKPRKPWRLDVPAGGMWVCG